MIDSAPQIVGLAIDLHKHLIEVPSPLTKAAHSVDPLALDVGRKDRTKSVPPEPHCLVTNVDPALEQQVFDVPQRERKTNVHHHHKPNDLR